MSDYLLRFFDFTVEPGKRYTYRVRLVIKDPNQPLFATPSVLDGAVLDRLRKSQVNGVPNRYIYAPWSEPSPAVGIPLDGRVRLASTTPGDEGRANLVVDGFGKAADTGTWVQAAKTKEFPRGAVVNFVEDSEYLIETQTHVDRYDSFKFLTGITVLDMRGGEKHGRGDLTAPSRVMVMGPSGNLEIRRELDDAADVQTHRNIFTKPRPGTGGRDAELGRRGGANR